MPNTFLEGLQRPAILQNNSGLPDYSEANDGDVLQIESGEPTWGAVDALPEIEESDEGKFLSVDQGEAVWADPKAIGNQCAIGTTLSNAIQTTLASMVQSAIQSSAMKHEHVSLSAPLNDYLPDAISIRQAVKKCVTDGVAATISVLGQSVALQTCVMGESNSTPEYTVCGTIPAYAVTVPQVGLYQFRIIVILNFVIDDSDNVSGGSYSLTVEPFLTPSTT